MLRRPLQPNHSEPGRRASASATARPPARGPRSDGNGTRLETTTRRDTALSSRGFPLVRPVPTVRQWDDRTPAPARTDNGTARLAHCMSLRRDPAPMAHSCHAAPPKRPDRRAVIPAAQATGMLLHAYCPDRAADGIRPAEAVRRHRARRGLSDRGTGGHGPRRDAVRQRRFRNERATAADVSAGVALRHRPARRDGAASADAGAGGGAGGGIRRAALPPGLLAVLAVQPARHAVSDHAARAARPAGAAAAVSLFRRRAAGVDLRRAAAAVAGREFHRDRASWPAGGPAAAAAGAARLPGVPRPHLPGKAPGPRHRDRPAQPA